MRAWRERFLAAVTVERGRIASRRRFLAGGGALAFGAAASVARYPGLVAKEEFADDADVLNYALSLEQLEAAFYRQGLERFDEAAFAEADQPEGVRTDLEAIRDQEEAHVDLLAEAVANLGGTPVEAGDYDFGFDDVAGFLETAAALEATGVAAYAGAAPALADRELLATLLGVHSVEARHAAYLNARVDLSPFPDAVDAPLSRQEVLAVAADFVAAAPAVASPAAASPAASPTADSTAEPPVLQGPSVRSSTGGDPAEAEDEDDNPAAEDPTEAAPPAADEPDEGDAPAESDEPRDREQTGDGEGTRDGARQERFAAVIEDAAAQLGVDPSEVAVVRSKKQEWPDASLGCPEEGEVAAQVITPGFLVVVGAAGIELEYHTDRRGNFRLCR